MTLIMHEDAGGSSKVDFKGLSLTYGKRKQVFYDTKLDNSSIAFYEAEN